MGAGHAVQQGGPRTSGKKVCQATAARVDCWVHPALLPPRHWQKQRVGSFSLPVELDLGEGMVMECLLHATSRQQLCGSVQDFPSDSTAPSTLAQ